MCFRGEWDKERVGNRDRIQSECNLFGVEKEKSAKAIYSMFLLAERI